MSTAVKTTGPSGLHQRKSGSKMVITEAGKAADKRLDSHETYVFFFLYVLLNKIK